MARRVEASDHFTIMSERELKAAITKLALRLGWSVFGNAQAKGLRPISTSAGYPDLTLAREGRVLFLECKAVRGVTSPAQDHWMRELPNAHVVRPMDWYAGKVAELLA